METDSDTYGLTGDMKHRYSPVESFAWIYLPCSNPGFPVLVGRRGFSVSPLLRRCVKSIQTTHCEYFPFLSELSQDTAHSYIKHENRDLENTVIFLSKASLH